MCGWFPRLVANSLLWLILGWALGTNPASALSQSGCQPVPATFPSTTPVTECLFAFNIFSDSLFGAAEIDVPLGVKMQKRFAGQTTTCYWTPTRLAPEEPVVYFIDDRVCVDTAINGFGVLSDPNYGRIYGDPACTPAPYCGNQCLSTPETAIFQAQCFLNGGSTNIGSFSLQSSAVLTKQFFQVNIPISPGGNANQCAETAFLQPGPSPPWNNYCNSQPIEQNASIRIRYALGTPPWLTPEQKQKYKVFGDRMTAIGFGATLAGAVPVAGAAAFVVGVTAFAEATYAYTMAADPADPNYPVVAQPVPPNLDLSSFPPAAMQLMQSLQQTFGYLEAGLTSVDRATGANIAGDGNSQQLQTTAFAGFDAQFSTSATQLPLRFAAWGHELLSSGVNLNSITLSQIVQQQQNIKTNGFPSNLITIFNQLGVDQSTIAATQNYLVSMDPNDILSVLQNAFAVGPLMPPILSSANNLQVFAAILPDSRSVQVSSPATIFATIINSGNSTATGCGIALNDLLPTSFTYQTTDPSTNGLTGIPNTPVDIPSGRAQSFVISLTPNDVMPAFPVKFVYFCANANAAPQSVGINELIFSASTSPQPDVIALAASGDPGIVDIPGANGTGAFAVATFNLGAGDQIQAVADVGAASIPVAIKICQTIPTSGTCLAPPASSVTTTINTNATPTFGIFVTGNGAVPFDPANNRVFVRFVDSSGNIAGSTSVAVRTQ